MNRFDQIIERRHSGCFKYDALEALYGRSDLLSMWVADMDFAVSDEIQKALSDRCKHPVHGYNLRLTDFCEAIISWQQLHYDWTVKREWIIAIPGLMPGLTEVVQTLTRPGDGVLIMTPVYRPFFNAALDFSRQLLISPLINDQGQYRIDWEDIEAKLQQARLFILCNPHNPVGRVWSRDELIRIGELCRKYNVRVFSDEIHADLVYPGYRHIPFASLDDYSGFTITGISPAKSFNVAGLATAVMVISDYELFREVNALNEKMHLYMGNSFGIHALIAAYNDSSAWLRDLLEYLNQTRKLITEFVLNMLPGVILSPIEGTYLAWLDFRAWGLPASDLQDIMVNKARLALDPGPKFGDEGAGFLRMNFACPQSKVREALQRIYDLHKELT